MILAHPASLIVCPLLVFLVVAVIGIDYVLEFPELIFEVMGLDFSIIQMSFLEFFTEMGEWVIHPLFETTMIPRTVSHGDFQTRYWLAVEPINCCR